MCAIDFEHPHIVDLPIVPRSFR